MQIIINATKVFQYPRAIVLLNANTQAHWSGSYCLHWFAVIPRIRGFLHSCIYPKKCMSRHPNSFSFLCHCAAVCANRDPWSWRFGLHGSSWRWDDCIRHTISLCTKGMVTWNQGVCMFVCLCEKGDNALTGHEIIHTGEVSWVFTIGLTLLFFLHSFSLTLIKMYHGNNIRTFGYVACKLTFTCKNKPWYIFFLYICAKIQPWYSWSTLWLPWYMNFCTIVHIKVSWYCHLTVSEYSWKYLMLLF